MGRGITLAVEEGEITGVLGLEIQGQRYDVVFLDGALNAVYPPLGGDAPPDREALSGLGRRLEQNDVPMGRLAAIPYKSLRHSAMGVSNPSRRLNVDGNDALSLRLHSSLCRVLRSLSRGKRPPQNRRGAEALMR